MSETNEERSARQSESKRAITRAPLARAQGPGSSLIANPKNFGLVRFALDSPLEGNGFELSVPRPDAELVGHITDTATDQGSKRAG